MCVPLFGEGMTTCVTRGQPQALSDKQRSDGLSHGQDDPEPSDYVGLEVPQK